MKINIITPNTIRTTFTPLFLSLGEKKRPEKVTNIFPSRTSSRRSDPRNAKFYPILIESLSPKGYI